MGEEFRAYYYEPSHSYSEEAPEDGGTEFTASYVLMAFFLVFFVATCATLYPEIAACYAKCSS